MIVSVTVTTMYFREECCKLNCSISNHMSTTIFFKQTPEIKDVIASLSSTANELIESR